MPSGRLTRDSATRALRAAAEWTQVAVSDLRISEYRAFRNHMWKRARPPSELAISLRFGGWRRACTSAARPPAHEDVEDEVRDRLYRPRDEHR